MTQATAKADAKEFDPVNLDQKWVDSLPEYTGPSKVHAIQIQHIETFSPGEGAPRGKGGVKVLKHQSLASVPSPSAIPAADRPVPEDYGDHAAARITPMDKSYPPFEVDDAYMRDCRPHTGGFYIVFETGAEGFEGPEAFGQKYTLVEKAEEIAAREEQAKKRAEQAQEQAAAELKKAEAAADPAAVDLAKEKLKNAEGAAKTGPKAVPTPKKSARKK